LSDCLVLIIAAGTRSVAVESTSHILNFHKENNQSKTPVRCFVRNQSGQKKDISEYFLTDNCHLSNCLVDIILAGARTGWRQINQTLAIDQWQLIQCLIFSLHMQLPHGQ
jgi:hypothetical protein